MRIQGSSLLSRTKSCKIHLKKSRVEYSTLFSLSTSDKEVNLLLIKFPISFLAKISRSPTPNNNKIKSKKQNAIKVSRKKRQKMGKIKKRQMSRVSSRKFNQKTIKSESQNKN